jgi:hypothetical protein
MKKMLFFVLGVNKTISLLKKVFPRHIFCLFAQETKDVGFSGESGHAHIKCPDICINVLLRTFYVLECFPCGRSICFCAINQVPYTCIISVIFNQFMDDIGSLIFYVVSLYFH